jgi:hypothetical protein
MAVIKKVLKPQANEAEEVTMPVFAYSNEGLAKLIVDLWKDHDLKRQVLARIDNQLGNPTPNAVETATDLINSRGGFKLKRAVVITEEEHDANYTMKDADEVVFVLPNESRVSGLDAAPPVLLDTAKMLMACTPNGI